MYDALEYVFLDQICTAMLGKTLDKSANIYFGAGRATEEIDKRLFCNDELLSPIASSV